MTPPSISDAPQAPRVTGEHDPIVAKLPWGKILAWLAGIAIAAASGGSVVTSTTALEEMRNTKQVGKFAPVEDLDKLKDENTDAHKALFRRMDDASDRTEDLWKVLVEKKRPLDVLNERQRIRQRREQRDDR